MHTGASTSTLACSASCPEEGWEEKPGSKHASYYQSSGNSPVGPGITYLHPVHAMLVQCTAGWGMHCKAASD